MAAPGNFFERIAVTLRSVVRFQFGDGVTPKTAGVMVWALIALAAVAIFTPSGPDKFATVLTIAGLVLLFLIGTWLHTYAVKDHPLEGGHIAEITRTLVGAKNFTPPALSSPLTENPAYVEQA